MTNKQLISKIKMARRYLDTGEPEEAWAELYLPPDEENNDDELILRKLLWIRHGCSVADLYCDDGEMSCGECLIDFKRDTPKQIENKFINNNIRKGYSYSLKDGWKKDEEKK